MKQIPFNRADYVGPVLEAGEVAEAVVAAFRSLNTGVTVEDRGSYLRVQCPGCCKVTRPAIETFLGRPFQLPGDLECVMLSFKGSFTVTEDEASWVASSTR